MDSNSQWGRVGLGKNRGTLEGSEGRGGSKRVGMIVEWVGHYYPLCMYDYTAGVILYHVQPKEQELYSIYIIYK